VSDQRLNALRTDDFETVYADVGEYLEVADQPDSRTQRTRLNQLRSDLKRFVARAANLGFAVHAVAGGPNWTDASHRYLAPSSSSSSRTTTGPLPPTSASKAHLIDMLRALPETYVLVMAYRNFTSGPDGSIEHVRSEFDYAGQAGTACGIVVGQELGQVYPEKLSFWWAGRAAFRQAAGEIAEAYGQRPQFRGLSVNDMSFYQAARE